MSKGKWQIQTTEIEQDHEGTFVGAVREAGKLIHLYGGVFIGITNLTTGEDVSNQDIIGVAESFAASIRLGISSRGDGFEWEAKAHDQIVSDLQL